VVPIWLRSANARVIDGPAGGAIDLPIDLANHRSIAIPKSAQFLLTVSVRTGWQGSVSATFFPNHWGGWERVGVLDHPAARSAFVEQKLID
jgi:hypothetical protein